MRWYNYLSSEDKDSLFNNEEIEENNLVVCQDLGILYFGRFNNYLEFARYYYTIVKPINHCFSEVIKGSQKPYFDLDIYIKNGISIEDAKQTQGVPILDHNSLSDKHYFTKEDAKLCVELLIARLKVLLPNINEKDIMVFNSNCEEKYSYHVIIDRWCYQSYEDNKALYEEVLKDYPDKFKPVLDNIYGSLKQLRIFNSHKWKSERVKVLDDEYNTWEPQTNPYSEKEKFIQILGGSLITNVSYCKFLPSFKPPNIGKSIYDGPDINLTNQEVDLSIDIFKSAHNNDFPYQISEIKGSMIILKRIRPSNCKICNRIHEHENPYLTITGKDKVVWYHCRRADDKLQLGKITLSDEKTVVLNNRIEKAIMPIEETHNEKVLSGSDLVKYMNTLKNPIKKHINSEDVLNYSKKNFPSNLI